MEVVTWISGHKKSQQIFNSTDLFLFYKIALNGGCPVS